MGTTTPLGAAARSRLRGFNAITSIVGLVVVAAVGIPMIVDPAPSAVVADDYRYEPWLNPDPTMADDEGDGVWTGTDTAMIRLEGLDPSVPLLVEDIGRERGEEGYAFDVAVTGRDGRIATSGDYGYPPEYYLSSLDASYIVPVDDTVELWVDGSNDDRWAVRVTPTPLDERTGTVSGTASDAFVFAGQATTARVSSRAEYSLRMEVVTAAGPVEVFSEDGRVDRSIAWEDADVVVFVVHDDNEGAWTIDFPSDPDPTETASADPTDASTQAPPADEQQSDGTDAP